MKPSIFELGDRVRIKSSPDSTGEIGQIVAINVVEVPMSGDGQMYQFDSPRFAVLIENSGNLRYPKMDDPLMKHASERS